jgi:hypothetical protein
MERWPKCDHLSSKIRLSGVTTPEAESFLATIWRILVENTLATPQIEVRLAGTLIDISLRFSSAVDCALVERRFHEIVQSTAA